MGWLLFSRRDGHQLNVVVADDVWLSLRSCPAGSTRQPRLCLTLTVDRQSLLGVSDCIAKTAYPYGDAAVVGDK
jgi:hypothetical protein